ncbi:GTP-binding protein [Rathayibacter tanaceti]|uniref:Cobalamin biosynthesis protein CobW n=2 Tax=Rathayibacter tanaceti TaxID=1671680 RepID=A0A166HZH1_9MICO|nr:GTP-binding protein [Rathayibacter tanaceti]KZX21393.1 putative metal chaperone YciC [Rathayibacter tanaceti]QHC54940.1 cobalamin biosynthesis protein CobW [Rathayibacter tanaceti]TCO38482.1 cobalamin synthesis protein cobW-like protein [Rathayibacter tanaceti]
MEPFVPLPPVLAVTLVSATDARDASRTAALLAGQPEGAIDIDLDLPGSDGPQFADELAHRLAAQADDGRRGHTVVALDPGADPLEIGLVLEHLCSQRHPGDTRIALLDVVAVTSAAEILRVLCRSGGPSADAGERLAARLEFASMIALTDPIDAPVTDDGALVLDLLHAIAPSAEVITAHERPATRRLLPRRAHALASSMGWQCALNGTSRPRSTSVQEFVFRDPLPFHPARLSAAVAGELVPEKVGRILRSRGLVRLATRADRVGSWSVAGDVLALDPTSLRSWDVDAPLGQEIAFFGVDLDQRALADVLSGCLLTPRELLAGPDAWASFADPFPRWVDEHRH